MSGPKPMLKKKKFRTKNAWNTAPIVKIGIVS